MKRLLPLLVLSVAFSSLHADEQTQKVQSALKDAGFYDGEVNGNGGEETGAALRRYQIRNGLEVTGSVNAETLTALKIEGAAPAPLPATITADPAVEASLPPERLPEPKLEPKAEPKRALPTPPAGRAQPPTSTGVSALRKFFAGTEYADAPFQEQSVRLAKAQSQLRQLKYYSGVVDGLPGPNTEEALLKFQGDFHLRLTGTLDSGTTQALNTVRGAVPGKKFRRPEPGVDIPVVRGIWVR